VEAGWPLALLAAGLVLWWLWRRWRFDGVTGLELGLEAAVVGALVFSLNDMNLRTPGPAFGLVLALAVLEPRQEGEPGRVRWPTWLGPLLGGLVLLAMVGWWQAMLLHRELRERQAPPAWRWGLVHWIQPLDGEAAAWRQDQGRPGWAWDAWAGRDEPAWWWSSSAKAGLAGDAALGLAGTRRALDLKPYDAPGWFLLGLRLQSQGQRTGALFAIQQSLKLEPNYCRALAWCCDDALAKHDKPRALKYFRALLKASTLKMGDDVLDDYSRGLQTVDPNWVQAHGKIFGRRE